MGAADRFASTVMSDARAARAGLVDGVLCGRFEVDQLANRQAAVGSSQRQQAVDDRLRLVDRVADAADKCLESFGGLERASPSRRR